MGFETKNNRSNNQDQLSLFDFKMPKADFVTAKSDDGSSAVDFNMWLMAHKEPEAPKTSRFMTVSATVHAAAFLLIAMMSIPLVEQVKTETITIEIEDVTPPKKMARGVAVPATQGGTPARVETPVVEKIEDAGSPSKDDVIVAKVAESKASKTAPAKASNLKASSKAVAKNSPKGGKASSAGRSIAPKTNFQAVPMTIDDIEAPELDAGAFANTPVESNMDEDFNEDFAKLDSSQKAALAKEKKSLDDMAAALAAEQDESLNAVDAANKEEAAQLAAAQEALRRKNANSIASALAAERAAAAAAAREAAARNAAAKRAGFGGEAGSGLGTKSGAGAGNTGSPTAGSQLAGVPSGVRSLDQLRQMPGNPRPQYDRQERLRGDQGKVAFIAYISKDGYPSKFRMMNSTGFRNLDAKTLAALKKWRFYPGQEGWVELPFRWDLKGGAQEDGGLLRRAIGTRQ